MEWSKIKNIIILILVLLNGFLLVLVGVREARSAHYQEEARSEAVEVLENSGIDFLPQRIPGDLSLPFWSVERERIGESEDAMAQALLGDVSKELQGGDIQASYTSEKGQADFYSSGRFIFTFQPGAMPLAGEEPERHAADCLEQLSFDGELVGTETAEGRTVVTFCQTWSGDPVFSCQAVFTYQEDALVSIDAQRLSGTAAQTEGEPLLSTASVLIRFLAGVNDGSVSVCTQIKEMTPGYQASLTRPVSTLTPVWRIVTDTGVYYLDGVTGEITAGN